MKKASKILTLILVVVLVLSVFAGCSLVGRKVSAYRNVTALSIGEGENAEQITVGKLLDTFNSYYNNYYYYISAGYLDVSQLLDMVISSIIQQYMQVYDYVTTHDAFPQDQLTTLQKQVHNAEYLTAEEFAYAVKYVNYLAYTAFDRYAEDNLTSKFDLGEAETEDTSRDFTEYDDWKGASSYAEYVFQQNFDSEDMDEYFDKYYPDVDVTTDLNLDKYLYDAADAAEAALAQKRVDEYNDRRNDKDGDELTVEEYTAILADTQRQYEETVSNNYGVTLKDFLMTQLADMVTSCIMAKWSYQYYSDITDDEFWTHLNEQYADAKDAQKAEFDISGNFDSFITSLGTSSNIYEVPADQADNYVFVKNILIPFSTAQTAMLTKLQNVLGETERDVYDVLRNTFASELLAQYFDSDKYDSDIEELFDKNTWFDDKKKEDDDDSLWKTKTNVFTTDASGNLIVNADGVLGRFFENGKVKPIDGMDAEQTIVELMKRFNTDTAQHTAAFDYVVYVGDDWEDYEHSWVKEFYTAVNEMVRDENAPDYALCVSTYGVHIIYLTGKVSESKKLFNEFAYKSIEDVTADTTSTPSYTLFKSYFDTCRSEKTQDALQALQKAKLLDNDNYKNFVKFQPGFEKFLKDNGFEYLFEDYIKELREEL